MNTKPSNTGHSGVPSAEAPWRIADVQRETGLGKDTLRVWERRYGFPLPERDAHGERCYTAEQLQQLKLIKRLMDAGARAGQVVGQSAEALAQMLAQPSRKTSAAKSRRTPAPAAAAIEEPWLTWLAADQTDWIKPALHRSIVRHGLSQALEVTIAPLCQQVGQAWMQGDISVYQEHLFTEVLQGVLRESIALIDGTASGDRNAPRVLLTTTPNEQHGLGLLMAECQFALSSCARFALGTSMPLSEMIEAVTRLNIDVLALSFSAHATRSEVADGLRQLQANLPQGVEIWIGGAGALAFSRAVPKGVLILETLSKIGHQVQTWREVHGFTRGATIAKC